MQTLRKILYTKKALYVRLTKGQTKLYFQEPLELDSLVNTGKLIQKFFPKQMDKVLKIILRKVLKGTYLVITVKEIQAGYLNSPYFKDLYS